MMSFIDFELKLTFFNWSYVRENKPHKDPKSDNQVT